MDDDVGSSEADKVYSPNFNPNIFFKSLKSSTKDDAATKPKSKRKIKNVLERMDACSGPFTLMRTALRDRRLVKITIRSFMHIRGFCTGYLVAFDKHFNLALIDVDETYIPPFVSTKKNKHKNRKICSRARAGDKCRQLQAQLSEDSSEDEDVLKERLLCLQKQLAELDDVSKSRNSQRPCESERRADDDADKPRDFQERIPEIDSLLLRANTQRHRRIEIRRRHIPQLFIRGDNVVTIQLLN